MDMAWATTSSHGLLPACGRPLSAHLPSVCAALPCQQMHADDLANKLMKARRLAAPPRMAWMPVAALSLRLPPVTQPLSCYTMLC